MSKSCGSERNKLTVDSLSERLRSKGLKLTDQRTAILESLINTEVPLSVDEILRSQSAVHELDLVTVYRCLKKFEDADLVTRLEFGDGISRFELTFESGHHHHHVICRKCHKVEILHICDLEIHLEAVRKMGYESVHHRLDFFGICPTCSKSK